MSDLKQTWQLVVDGNTDAWQELVDTYSGFVYTVARKVGLSIPDAEDCAQQTWLALYRSRKKIKDPVALPAWLMKTTHRRAVQLFRKYGVGPPATAEAGREPVDDRAQPDELLAELESLAILQAAVADLDDRCRKLVTALFLSGNQPSYNEVSRLLGIRPNSLGPLRSRCLAKLKKILGEMGYETD